MGRGRRVDVRGEIYRVLNRANSRSRLFQTPAHFQDFLAIGGRRFDLRAQGHSGLRPDAETLAPGAAAAGGRRPVEIPMTHHAHPHAALSCAHPDGRIRACLPGPLQIVSGGVRPAFPDAGALRGEKRQARRLGEEGRRLAVVERGGAWQWPIQDSKFKIQDSRFEIQDSNFK